MVSAFNFKSVDEGKFTLTANGFLPHHAFIPLEEDEKGVSEILVKAGDTVKEGQVIAKTENLYIHASIPGKVEEIVKIQYSNGKQGLCAKIVLNGSLTFTGKKLHESDFNTYESSTLAFMLKEAGVVNTFDNPEPVYRQIKKINELNEKHKKEANVLVLRLFDDDPSRLVEGFISKTYFKMVMTGAAIVAKAVKAKAVVIAQDKNAPLNAAELLSVFDSSAKIIEVQLDTKKYPCGTKHDIVAAVKKASKDELFAKLGKNDFFIDSITALHSYNAVVLGKPVLNSFIHITGDCLNSAAIMNIKTGTTLEDLVAQCGGFKRKLSKIVFNGILKGRAVSSLEIPLSKSAKSIEFLPASEAKIQHTQACIRCGNCRKICPVHIWPGNLYRVMHLSGTENKFLNTKSIAESSILCTECGLCNSACPSRLPLSQTITMLKEKTYEQE